MQAISLDNKRQDAQAAREAVVADAVARVKAHMATSQVQDALIKAAVSKAVEATVANEKHIGRGHHWRGFAVGALAGAGAMAIIISALWTNFAGSAALLGNITQHERAQQDLARDLDERIHP